MNFEEFKYKSNDNTIITFYKWSKSTNRIKGVVLIVHGMAEHAKRYDDFAKYLLDEGYIIYALDLRGHGQTGAQMKKKGFFSEYDGWNKTVSDVKLLATIIQDNYHLPINIFGHSMGSLITRNILYSTKNIFNTAILSGTTMGSNKIAMFFAKQLANYKIKNKKGYAPSYILDKLIFGSYNKNINHPKTKFDWLSKDSNLVNIYLNDDSCGFVCTNTFFRDLFEGISNVTDVKNINLMNKKTPLLLIGGELDPVCNNSRDIHKLNKILIKNSFSNTTIKIYQNMRHEVLNEINKEIVFNDIVKWLNKYNKSTSISS
ncbi:MAG: alpha/beta fold hydrolase [Eubacteriaceae bacterium]